MENRKNNWLRYMGAWSETDPEKRMNTLQKVLDQDATYTDPATEGSLSGCEAIAAHIGQTQQMIPGIRLEITTYEAHHDVSMAEWNMCNADNLVLSTGKSFARYGSDDTIKETVGFFRLG